MRASRLVNLLLLLQSRGGLTAAELASELEVSVRTIHRDVEELSAAGVPIYAERGPTGGIRLIDGYRTRLTGMTADEAEALFLAGLPGPAAQLGLGTVVAAAQLKVMAALPPELRSRASRLVQRFHLDPAGWFQTSEAVPHLSTLAAAVWEGRLVEMRYERSDAVVERTIGPIGLVLKGGIWYVVGQAGDQVRTYRASRVREAVALDTTFERPRDFDLPAYWADARAAYESGTDRMTFVVRLAPHRLSRLESVFGRSVVDAADRLDETDPDGWLRLRLTVGWPDEVPRQLLSIGSSLEVVEPPGLRDAVIDTAGRILERYRA